MSVPGFNIPIHNSLTTPILLGGVPRKLAILNGTMGAAFLFGLHSLWIIPICAVVHVGAMMLAKRDPYFFQVGLRHIRKRPYYKV